MRPRLTLYRLGPNRGSAWPVSQDLARLQIQPELLLAGTLKLAAIEPSLVTIPGQLESLARRPEARREHVGVGTAASLPDAEAVVVIATPAGLPNQAHDMLCAVGKMF